MASQVYDELYAEYGRTPTEGEVLLRLERKLGRDRATASVETRNPEAGADLTGADLSNANLQHADLRGADLEGTNLEGADLSEADLEDATGVTVEELEEQAASLEAATMPDGTERD